MGLFKLQFFGSFWLSVLPLFSATELICDQSVRFHVVCLTQDLSALVLKDFRGGKGGEGDGVTKK